jgi:hypothetical protein
VNVVMSSRVFQMTENISISQATINYSCKILFHVVALLRNGHKTDLRKFVLKILEILPQIITVTTFLKM